MHIASFTIRIFLMTIGSDTAVIAVTEKGISLAKLISNEINADIYTPSKLGHADTTTYDSIAECFDILFHSYKNIIAVMAQGIVTRMIAPHIESKYTDQLSSHVMKLGDLQ